MSNIKTGWYKTYRPKNIDQYIFQTESEKSLIMKYIESQDIPDLLFSGHQGTGKTTLALILKDALNISDLDFLRLNASDDNSVDNVRNEIKSFIGTMSVGKYKIVFLDEADALTIQAQDALKSIMEDESRNARFILTCNNPNKLTPQIRSRCTEYKFKSLNKNLMKAEAVKILLDVGCQLDIKNTAKLNEQLDEFLALSYPDFRKFLTLLEKHYKDGVLHSPEYEDVQLEINVSILTNICNSNWKSCRDIIYESMNKDSIIDCYKFLDDNMDELMPETNQKKAYLALAHYAALHETVVLPELNLLACIIKLCELRGD